MLNCRFIQGYIEDKYKQTNKQKQPHLSKIDFCSYDGVKHHCSVLDAWLCPEPSIKTENNE